jgi:ABC-type multidrug transport system permease subunit
VNLRFACISAVKDLARRATDPLALVLWIGLPVLIGGLLSLMGGGSGSGARGTVLLADEDGGLAGRAIEAVLSQGPLGSLLEIRRVKRDEGRALMDEGEASALVIVPPGATDAVLEQRPLALTLVTNPAQRILPAIVAETLELTVEATFYAQRLLAEQLRFLNARRRSESFPADAEVATLATTLNARLRSLETVAFPPVMNVTLEQAPARPAAGPAMVQFGQLFLPGLLFMSLLFIAQGMSADVWEEQVQGTLRRAVIAPPGPLPFVVGKLLAAAVLMSAVALAGLAVAVLAFEVAPARAALALPWCVFGGTVLFALLLVPQVAASSQAAANLLSSMLVFPLMMVGGSFFPFEVMPPWMAVVGRWTPNGQGVALLKHLLAGTATAPAVLIATTAMSVPAALALLWATGRLRRRLLGAA